jgi:hypothetical protein
MDGLLAYIQCTTTIAHILQGKRARRIGQAMRCYQHPLQSIGWTGSAIFVVFNGNILWRLLRSDGYIGARANCSFDRGVPAISSNGTGSTHPDSNVRLRAVFIIRTHLQYMKESYDKNVNHPLNGVNSNTNGQMEPRRRHI